MKPIIKILDSLWFAIQRIRFGGICKICGKRTSEPAHHIFGRGLSVRWEIDNGILLCRECHIKAHNKCKLFRVLEDTPEMFKLFRTIAHDVDFEAIKLKLEAKLKELENDK
jgi:hypothetical protein